MAIKHLGWYSSEELKKNDKIPIWEKREILTSPLVIFVGLGYFIYGILYGIFFLTKWILFSWIAPFIYVKWFCKIGFHKYRKLRHDNYTGYFCIICGKELVKVNSDMYE